MWQSAMFAKGDNFAYKVNLKLLKATAIYHVNVAGISIQYALYKQNITCYLVFRRARSVLDNTDNVSRT